MKELLLISCAILSAYCFFRAGQISGRENARAEGWLERWQQEQARDRARRNRLGQFKGKGAES